MLSKVFRPQEAVVLLGVLVVGVLLRLVKISQPFIDEWSWRQSDIAMIADNFYRLAYNHQVQKGINVFAVYDKEPTTPAQFSVKLVFALPVSTSNFLKLVGAGSPQTP